MDLDFYCDLPFFKSFALTMLSLVAILGFVYVSGMISCKNSAELMGLDYSFKFFSGCLVEYGDGKFIPIDNYVLHKEG